MKKAWGALVCILIISALLVSALAETRIAAWIDEYNKSAAVTGAPRIENGTEAATPEGDYILVLSQSLSLSVSFNEHGDVYLLTAVTTSPDNDIASPTASALAASDDGISVEQAVMIIGELNLTSAIADKNTYIITEKNGWVFWLMNTGTADEFQFTVSIFNGNTFAAGKDKPISGFWDGLWEDDDEEAKPEPAPDKSASKGNKLHKI